MKSQYSICDNKRIIWSRGRKFHITQINLSQDRGYGNEDVREREDQWSLWGNFVGKKQKKTSHEKYIVLDIAPYVLTLKLTCFIIHTSLSCCFQRTRSVLLPWRLWSICRIRNPSLYRLSFGISIFCYMQACV